MNKRSWSLCNIYILRTDKKTKRQFASTGKKRTKIQPQKMFSIEDKGDKVINT